MDSSEIESLFARTLNADYDAENAWDAVSALRSNGCREIFDRAAAWCSSEDPLQRARAVDILCQLSESADLARADESSWRLERMFRSESYALISKMLADEPNCRVVASIVYALGHLGVADGIPLILGYRKSEDENIRFAVAFALGCYPDEPHAVSGLLGLTSDPCADVRDWAVFGVGVQVDADSPDIRAALLTCLNDPDENVREEAAVGLGKRRDQRVLPKLLEMLDGPVLKVRVTEAATLLLGLEKEPCEWLATDYKSALKMKFGMQH